MYDYGGWTFKGAKDEFLIRRYCNRYKTIKKLTVLEESKAVVKLFEAGKYAQNMQSHTLTENSKSQGKSATTSIGHMVLLQYMASQLGAMVLKIIRRVIHCLLFK